MLKHVLMVLALMFAAPADATDWKVDKIQSDIRFGGTHSGEAFSLVFETYQLDIQLDPAAPESGSIKLVLDAGSARTGRALYDRTVQGEEWLDGETFATIGFTSTAIRREGDGYVAEGVIDLKGQSFPISVPFTLALEGQKAVAKGALDLDRLLLEVGIVSDPGAAWVSQMLALTFTIVATH